MSNTSTLPEGEQIAREFRDGRVRPATANEILAMGLYNRTRLYRYLKDGTIPTINVAGRRHLVPADEVRRLLGLSEAEGGESK